MLHSALPRAFLPPPGLCYLGGYYGEVVHPYSPVSRFVSLENAYAGVQEHQHMISSLEPARPMSPIPLDLSLKPPPPAHSPRSDESEAIEVDNVEGHQDDGFSSDKLHQRLWESRFSIEDRQPRPYLYDHQELARSPQDSPSLYPSESNYQSPSSSPVPTQKLLLSSPGLRTYQQQLLLTPQHHLHSPMTPPSTPSPPQCPRRRAREEEDTPGGATPITTTPKSSSADKTGPRAKKKHARRLKFDEDTSSPVSGTVILGPDEAVVTGDIDPAFNIVEVTEEARAELAKIENRLGPYQCKLCRHLHDDAFQLAQHRCSRIAHVEYRCPECDKRFSCPANLASHRRWHKPRIATGDSGGNSSPTAVEIACTRCDAKFTRQAALRKHLATQHPEMNNNLTMVNNNVSVEASGVLVSTKPLINVMQHGATPLAAEVP